MLRLLYWVLLGSFLALCACSKPEPTIDDYARQLPDAISDAIDEAIDDPARAQEAKSGAIRLGYAIDAYTDEAWKIRTRAFFLNANYATTREKFDTFLLEIKAPRKKIQNKIIQEALGARETMTEEEWQAFHAALNARFEPEKEGE